MLNFLNRPDTASFGSVDDTGFANSDYLDAFWAKAQISIAGGVPVARARCSSDIMCVILNRPSNTTMYPGDSPAPFVWCGTDRGELVIWEDVGLSTGTVVLE